MTRVRPLFGNSRRRNLKVIDNADNGLSDNLRDFFLQEVACLSFSYRGVWKTPLHHR